MGRKPRFKLEQVADAIHALIRKTGVAPTIEELGSRLGGASSRTVLRYLRELEAKGYIERWSGARGLKPLKGPEQGIMTRAVPLVGEVPAGAMVFTEENIEAWIRFPTAELGTRASQLFLVKVRGNSMNRAEVLGQLIEDGDLALVRHQSTARPGEVVVLAVDGEVTVKRLVRGHGYYILRPESSERQHQPIVIPRRAVVQGVVVRIFKKGSRIVEVDD